MSQEIEPMTNNKIHTRSILFTKTRNKKHTLKRYFYQLTCPMLKAMKRSILFGMTLTEPCLSLTAEMSK